jgi:hypothetical protein
MKSKHAIHVATEQLTRDGEFPGKGATFQNVR